MKNQTNEKRTLSTTKDLERPWGGFIQFVRNEPCTVKILLIKYGGSLSLQFHEKRDELWYPLSGRIMMYMGQLQDTIDKTVKNLQRLELKEDGIFIPRYFVHKAEGLLYDESRILEISFGDFDENDIVRVADNYGRISEADAKKYQAAWKKLNMNR